MNKLFISIVPTLSLATIVSCGCNNTTTNISIDRKYFEIEGTILKDFKQEYKRKESIAKGDKLTIFKDITSLGSTAFSIKL